MQVTISKVNRPYTGTSKKGRPYTIYKFEDTMGCQISSFDDSWANVQSGQTVVAEVEKDETHPKYGRQLTMGPITGAGIQDAPAPQANRRPAKSARTDYQRTTDERIQRQVAFKGAIDIISSDIRSGEQGEQDIISRCNRLTNSFDAILSGVNLAEEEDNLPFD